MRRITTGIATFLHDAIQILNPGSVAIRHELMFAKTQKIEEGSESRNIDSVYKRVWKLF